MRIARLSEQERRLSPTGELVLRAIRNRKYSDVERQWIKRIEIRRERLIASTEVIEYVDYGAGSSTDVRTAEEMLRGAVRQAPVSRLTKIASKNPKWAGLLFRLVRDLKPEHGVELGAAAGISASYQAAALHLNGRGRLTSLEGGASIAELATSTLVALGLDDRAAVITGRFQDTLEGVLAGGDVDYAFIDGHHDDIATRVYFDMIVERMPRPGVVLLDDIAWSPGMKRAWQHVSRRPEVAASFNLGGVGVCVIDDVANPVHMTVSYD